jgi:hypothetical protein
MVEEAISQYYKNNDSSLSSNSLILSDVYPDPRSLSAPPALLEPIPSVTLSELEPGKYNSTTARVVYLSNSAVGFERTPLRLTGN